ncbi:ECF family RNA polymerase sigma factor [Sorangium cellulosum]|uniref:ECF family RNA polymerase sigma factor n=1 Tax=Sorangium cellulosum TaxID=56 RepID=A0A4P2PXJ7_SORCE|nr:sigma-70 family RNA polymerase sigma factor [Sorangium cellulosum]AUX21595.1 ECF family RNA polymerase sigma factor [Sorangium cellulosum]
MKDPPDTGIHPSVEQCLQPEVLGHVRRPPSDLTALHAEHGGFVWATLQRFGIRHPDLEDAFQDVFIVVQRRLPAFDWACPITTWLFAICRRVAAAHRRRAYTRRERLGEVVDEVPDSAKGPEELTSHHQARVQLEEILEAMDLDRRAVFVMFEIEEMPCSEIASLVGVPVGTVYSRLHAARKEFAALLRRTEAERTRRGGT